MATVLLDSTYGLPAHVNSKMPGSWVDCMCDPSLSVNPSANCVSDVRLLTKLKYANNLVNRYIAIKSVATQDEHVC